MSLFCPIHHYPLDSQTTKEPFTKKKLIFTHEVIGGCHKHDAKAGLVVHRIAGGVTLARLQTVHQHEVIFHLRQFVVRRRESVAGHHLEAQHLRIAIV